MNDTERLICHNQMVAGPSVSIPRVDIPSDQQRELMDKSVVLLSETLARWDCTIYVDSLHRRTKCTPTRKRPCRNCRARWIVTEYQRALAVIPPPEYL